MTMTEVLNQGWTDFAKCGRRGLVPVFGATGA